MYKETHTRSIVKTISWRILATLTTITLVYIFIGDVTIALSVGGIEVFLKMLIYFLHERAWDKIKFGRKEVKPMVVWITGLSRSGKSQIGRLLVETLKKKDFKVEHLDGHTIRGLIPGTGYTRKEVNDHIKRVGYLGKKLEEQGVIVVATFLSPFSESREFVKNLVENFYEVYISTPAEVCAERDDKGVYKKAMNGELENFPGVSVEYEIPSNPKLTIDTTNTSIDKSAELIYKNIKNKL
ncbi:MAG: adenylyl-sulfate kinase [Chlorobi bacterium]|nr:adenylyl-sulfate kinase [Chlorobiota bacterium]